MKTFVRFFPKFSEIETISIIYIFAFSIIYNFIYKAEKILYGLYSNISGLIVIDILILGIIFAYTYKLIYILSKSAFTKEKLKDSQRVGLATTFYLLSSLITLIASFEFFINFEYSILNLVNSFVLFYILLRSLFVLSATNPLLNQDPKLIIERFDDRQTNKLELTILLILVPVIYIFLKPNYSFFTALALTYFYSDIILVLLRNFPFSVRN